ncbi:carbohydrate-binding protein [Paenibacillus sp. BC26]|uniref:carbohydrate-binding protein n=1 Tax=Paenibacillus sp. BC26 TaxID=1881032 RepID=UPI0008EB530B|nr:carbohydrate-binding protein [Paenibacillus sp. BC26]SFT13076.1 Carbohydrate binding module (family 6) [Paenibacillus sp. BC26]
MKTLTSCLALILFICSFSFGTSSLSNADATASAANEVVYSYEAEATGNTMTGNASIADCSGCSGSKKVGGLYQGSSMRFTDIEVPEAGSYNVVFSYISGDPRSADISANGGTSRHIDFDKTADWNTLATLTIPMTLVQGSNYIDISDGNGYSPDFDKIDVYPIAQGYEAEASGNTLTGNAAVSGCGACSGGQKVGNLYQGASLQFNAINVPSAGSYNLTVYYISGDPRAADVSTNGGPAQNVLFQSTKDWSTVGSQTISVNLVAGSNTILFSDGGGYSPDMDKIVVTPIDADQVKPCEQVLADVPAFGAQVSKKKFGSIKISEYADAVVIQNGDYAVTYRTDSGMADYAWKDKTIAKGVYSKFEDEASSCYDSHSFSMADVAPLKDGFGKGVKVKFVNSQAGSPTLNQWYSFYEDKAYFFTRTEAVSAAELQTNYMAPLVTNTTGGIDIGSYTDGRVLSVPYDNDMWIRHQAVPINSADTSYEVSAIYDNANRNGLIVGSVTHDTWKTGIRFTGENNRLNQLEVFGGASTAKTHDSVAHGSIKGTVLTSPMAFVGFYGDYRKGMEEYGKANAVIAPPLAFGKKVPEGVPVGWNSWGAFGSNLTYQDVLDTSDYVKQHLQMEGFNNKKVTYINLDSYWDNLTEAQLADVVAKIRKNGQKAGIYWGPFVYWGDNMEQQVEGSSYKYGDIILRDESGNPLPKLDGAYAVDPSHPGAKDRMTYFLNRFKNLGFEYIKLDFLTHGALEGKHYDPEVQTGTQAYNQGMAYVDSLIADKMFISASIAPLFPSQYAHSRRIATDTFGSISDTEFQLNALTYGWWQNGTIYHYTDPDHMALSRAGSLTEARSRVNSAVISGTVFMDSDNVHDAKAQEYMTALLTNKAVLEVAQIGKAFRPIEGNTGAKAAEAFVLKDKGDYYLAFFNYGSAPVDKTVDLARAGLDSGAAYKLKDLWTGAVSGDVQGSLQVTLEPMESKLFRLTPKN